LHFSDAAIVFAGLTITAEDVRRDYGEVRFQTVGCRANGDGRLDTANQNPTHHFDEKVQ
jgi:uncharacterized DUF497 family protein